MAAITFFPRRIGKSVCMLGLWFGLAASLFYGNSVGTAGTEEFQTEPAWEALTNQDKDSLDALLTEARAAVSRQAWQKAADLLDKALRMNPTNLEALYLRGIVFRETGKFKALLLRRRDWNRAENLFSQVIAADSTYKDILYQRGLLERYRGHFEEAILWAERQLRIKPRSLPVQLGFYNFYRYLIRHRSKEDALTWLAQRHTVWDAVFTAEKLRREGAPERARMLLSTLLAEPQSKLPSLIYLYLARTYADEMLSDSCQSAFWEAVAHIDSPLAAHLIFEDIKYIASDEEIMAFRECQGIGDWRRFFQSFWEKRNLFPGEPLKERLVEHYQRLVFAEKYFEYDGFRTWVNNPDELGYLQFPLSYSLNNEFNDKGLIYLRHGKANDWARTVGDGIPDNESWLYYRNAFHPELVFHFMQRNAAANNWRLAPYVTDFRMLEDRLNFGPEYSRLLHATPVERLSIIDEMAQRSKKDVSIGLTSESQQFPENIRPLKIPFRYFTFQGAGNRTDLYWIYRIPAGQFSADSALTKLRMAVVLHDLNWEKVAQNIQIDTVTRSQDLFRLIHLPVIPDSYHVSFHARVLDRPQREGFRFSVRIPDYSAPTVAISDILLWQDTQGDASKLQVRRNQRILHPQVDQQFSPQRPIKLYFEIYHLTPDPSGEYGYTLEYAIRQLSGGKRKLRNLFGLFGRQKTDLSIENRQTASSPNTFEYLELDLQNLSAGEYELTISVTDQESGETTKTTTQLQLR